MVTAAVRRLHVANDRLLPAQDLRPAVGVLALATDANVESELRVMLPSAVRMYTSRIRNACPLTPESIHRTADGITDAGNSLLPGQPLDALVYACTAGAALIGVERVEELLRRAKRSALCTSPIQAAVRAMRSLGIQRPAILTPNVETVSEVIGKYFDHHGFTVSSIVGLGFLEDFDIARIPPEVIADMAIRCCEETSDGVLICCTTLHVSPVIDEIERVLGVPVVTSNQAVVWQIARHLDISPTQGLGSLLSTIGDASPLTQTSPLNRQNPGVARL